MKKLLSILATIGLTATAATSVVACAPTEQKTTTHKANVPESALEINLKETHKGADTLTEVDQTLVKKTVLDKLKELNDDAVINDDTFAVVGLDKVTPSDEAIKITVKATEAKDDKKGLEEETVEVKLKLKTPNYGQKEVVSIKKQPITLDETAEGAKLAEADKSKVKETITNALTKANTDVVIEKDTFDIQLSETKTSDTKIKVKVKETQGNQDKYGLKAKEINVEVQFSLTKNSVLEKVQKIGQEGLVISKGLEEIKDEDVTAQLTEALKEFGDKVTFEQKGSSSPITIDETGIKKGEAIFTIKYQGVAITDPKTEKDEFTIPFIVQELERTQKTLDYLQKDGVDVQLTNFELGGDGIISGPLGNILELAGGLIKDNKLIPDKIPAEFKLDSILGPGDEYWQQWDNSLNTLRDFLDPMGIKIDEEMAFDTSFKMPNSEVEILIKGKLKIANVLTSILPDLIHFRNFMIEQKEETGNENLLLLFIQYLLDEPRDIKEDGFSQINLNVKSLDEKYDFKPQTNLENLLWDLLHGWKNSNGVKWAADKTSIPALAKYWQPMTIKITTADMQWTGLNIEYFSRSLKLGIVDLLPIENLKAFINQLFNYDLGQPLDLEIYIPDNIDIPDGVPTGKQTVPLGDLLGNTIKDGIKNILNTDKNLKGNLDDLDFDWKAGTLRIEIQKGKDSEWVYAENLDDLAEATDFRVKFISNTLEVKYKDWTFTLEDINITIDLDISSSIIID